MYLDELKGNLQELFPNALIEVSLDNSCVKCVELLMHDGNPRLEGHVVFDKAKVVIDSGDPSYMKIKNHRMIMCWADIKALVETRNNVWIPGRILSQLKDMKQHFEMSDEEIQAIQDEKLKEAAQNKKQSFPGFKKEVLDTSGLLEEDLDAKIEGFED